MDNTETSMEGSLGINHPVEKIKREKKRNSLPIKVNKQRFKTHYPPSCAENTITQSQVKWWCERGGGGVTRDPASVFKVQFLKLHFTEYICIYIYCIYIYIHTGKISQKVTKNTVNTQNTMRQGEKKTKEQKNCFSWRRGASLFYLQIHGPLFFFFKPT